MKKVRLSLGEIDVRASSLCIQTRLLNLEVIRRAEILLIYVSVAKEVQTRPLLQELLVQGKRVMVPRVVGSQVEAYEISQGCGWRTGPFGLPIPRTSSRYSGPLNACIIPGLAFSTQCDRLGFGYGHWDRFLSQTQVGTVIGICHDRQILESIPVENTDRPADLVVTEERILLRIPNPAPGPRLFP